MSSKRILIAEDHALFRQGIRSLIESSGASYVVVAEAKDGLEAVAAAIELEPDIVLIDLCMPNQNGMESIAAIKKRLPDIKVIALTAHRSEEHVRVSLEAGADGYVLKDDTSDDLLQALRACQEGKVFLSPAICGGVVSGYLGRGEGAAAETGWGALSPRERQVLKLAAQGKRNREIADVLSLSIKTVEKHRATMMRKLGLSNASELVAYALETGLIQKP